MESLVAQGSELAMFGMGSVFIFLTLLIGATKLMSGLVLRFAPDEVEPVVAAAHTAVPANDAQLIAVISAAIKQFRSR